MKPYTLLIFDWDGTLMDSEAHIVACMQAAMRLSHVEVLNAEAIRNIIGLGLVEAMCTLFPHHDQHTHQTLLDTYRHYFFSDEIPASTLFPQAEAVVKQLAEHDYHLAIATGKSRRGLDLVLTQSGLAPFFPITRCADETFSKPHPCMLEEILTDYDTDASQALMIGDSTYDLAMANNAGMDALAVTYGVQRDRQKLLAHQPIGIIDRIDELPQWLNTHQR
ncbi:MAG: HAD family hydrolase [bacterium]